MNCNVTINTQDIALGRSIATAIRMSTHGGLPGVQVLALPHEGAVEIACNVESVKGSPPTHMSADEPWPSFNIDGQPYYHAPGFFHHSESHGAGREAGGWHKGHSVGRVHSP